MEEADFNSGIKPRVQLRQPSNLGELQGNVLDEQGAAVAVLERLLALVNREEVGCEELVALQTLQLLHGGGRDGVVGRGGGSGRRAGHGEGAAGGGQGGRRGLGLAGPRTGGHGELTAGG